MILLVLVPVGRIGLSPKRCAQAGPMHTVTGQNEAQYAVQVLACSMKGPGTVVPCTVLPVAVFSTWDLDS
jgi:hypothetical protein